MTTTQTDWSAELTVLEAMARELEAYIAANEVYRTLLVNTGAGNQQYKMSGGDVLARVNALNALQAKLSSSDQQRLAAAVALIEKSIHALRTRFHDLLRRELKSRLGTLQWSADTLDREAGDTASPADRQNQQHIAAIRKELGPGVAAKGAAHDDEMDDLEEQLQQALKELKDLAD
ncbi:MAG: hypothetical protein R3A44_09985 [Caldilineaceae bacterium]